MSPKTTALAGLAATILFASSLVLFAVAHPGYAHGTKAISELGASGAPNALAWNLVGFLLTGLLLTIFGLGVGTAVDDRRTGLYLALSGMAFSATAAPADMENLQSPLSLAHVAASILVFVFWLAAALRIARGSPSSTRRATMMFLLFAVLAGATRFTSVMLPGWGQRLSFLAYFGWVITISILLVVKGSENVASKRSH